MNGIIGMTEPVALDTEALTPSQQREYLVDRQGGAPTRFSTIINDILDFSKIEAGKLDLEMVPFGHPPETVEHHRRPSPNGPRRRAWS